MTSSRDEYLAKLVPELVSWSATHGLAYGVANDPSKFVHAPTTVLPSPVSRSSFRQAQHVAPLLNKLVDTIARDPEWLYETLHGVLDGDEFTKRLVELSKLVHDEGLQQTTYLGIHRSDYMLDKPRSATDTFKLLQIELNTIASSFGCLSTRVSEMHEYLLNRFGYKGGDGEWGLEHLKTLVNGTEHQFPENGKVDWSNYLPKNTALKAIPSAMAQAVFVYQKQTGISDDENMQNKLVVFVVQKGETNSFDQRWLEYTLWDEYKVPCKRYSLDEVQSFGELRDVKCSTGTRKALFMHGLEVAVVYFRAGYTPNDYPSELEWEGRTLLERSAAIKCPSVAYHLVGTKKVQQALAIPGVVEKFTETAEEAKLIRECFAGLWTLDPAEDKDGSAAEAKARAIENGDGYVLKPQREGGGNNYYGKDVPAKLQELPPKELASYILMQRIVPEEHSAILVRNCKPTQVEAVSELGVFGVYIGDKDGCPVLNETAGHLLRTKQSGVDEGGVATGYSFLDSPFLV